MDPNRLKLHRLDPNRPKLNRLDLKLDVARMQFSFFTEAVFLEMIRAAVEVNQVNILALVKMLAFEACHTDGIVKVVRYLPVGSFTCGKCGTKCMMDGTYASAAHMVAGTSWRSLVPDRALFPGIMCMPCARGVYREAAHGADGADGAEEMCDVSAFPLSRHVLQTEPESMIDVYGIAYSVVDAASDLLIESKQNRFFKHDASSSVLEQARRVLHSEFKARFYGRMWLELVRRRRSERVEAVAQCAEDTLGVVLDAHVRFMINYYSLIM